MENNSSNRRVIGLGGVFMKSADPKALREWYVKHLGIDMQEWGGAMFPWTELASANKDAYSLISFFKEETKHFEPSSKPFMLNFVVADLDWLHQQLESEGIKVEGKQDSEFGKFAWIMDPDGNKVELWEPAKSE